MTSATPISSTPVLRTTLLWASGATLALAVIGGIAGAVVGGTVGLVSALLGVLVAFVFLGITAASILIANRWQSDALFLPIFFGIVLGGWILKLILFVVAMLLLRGQPWIDPVVFFVAAVVSVLATLVIDVVVMMRMRIPTVSDSSLPTEVVEDVAPGSRVEGEGGPARGQI